MEDLNQLAKALDKNGIPCPPNILIADHFGKKFNASYEALKNRDAGIPTLSGADDSPTNFSDLITRVQHKNLDEASLDSLGCLLQELKQIQDPRLWMAYLTNHGELHIDKSGNYNVDTTTSSMGTYIETAYIKQANGKFKPGGISHSLLTYNHTESDSIKDKDSKPATAHHELGHWIDDKLSLLVAAGRVIDVEDDTLMGFHSRGLVWKKVKELEAELHPDGMHKQIKTYVKSHLYLETEPAEGRPRSWQEEFFAEAVARHFGPHFETRKPAGVLTSYLQTIVSLDVQIVGQDKPPAEKHSDRKKLFTALREPLESHFDMPRIDDLLEKFDGCKPGKGKLQNAARDACIKSIESEIKQGLGSISRKAAEEVGIKFGGTLMARGDRKKDE